jgi:hypothetical protein
MKGWRAVPLGFFLSLWGCFGSFPPASGAGGAAYELQITQLQGGREKVLFRSPAAPQKTFRIRYTHSWDKCPIIEIFRIEKDASITLTEEIYGWFGAGLEFNPETGFTDMKDRRVHIQGIERNLPSIPIRVGWVSGFCLEYGKQVIPLDSLALPGTLVTIRIVSPRGT